MAWCLVAIQHAGLALCLLSRCQRGASRGWRMGKLQKTRVRAFPESQRAGLRSMWWCFCVEKEIWAVGNAGFCSTSKASGASQLTAFLCQAGRKRTLLNRPEVNEGHCHPVTRWLITASAGRAASKRVGIVHDVYAAMYLKGNLYGRRSEHRPGRGRGGLAPVNPHLPPSSCTTNRAPSGENKRKPLSHWRKLLLFIFFPVQVFHLFPPKCSPNHFFPWVHLKSLVLEIHERNTMGILVFHWTLGDQALERPLNTTTARNSDLM